MNVSTMICIEDFTGFFQELWGYDPFPWQIRLLRRVVEAGWPSVLDLPTGTGKTSVLEIACFALALDAHQPVEARQQPRRIALVIDRRIVVDQAYERACTICSKLKNASSGVLQRVASSLMSLHSGLGSSMPIIATSLRGGTVRDTNWCRSPDQPCFLISTVDQVGSRLLFRGYGVSSGMAPIHAGLLGVDCLYFLDEIHLSRPFLQSLQRLVDYANSPLVEEHALRPPCIVSMSATPGKTDSAFRLDQDDYSNSTLNKRLSSEKRAVLVKPVKVSARRDVANTQIAKVCCQQVKSFLKNGAHTVAIIVNRIDTARRAADLVQGGADRVVLLTGRMRSLDRDDVQREVNDELCAGRKRSKSRTIIVVSTQAIEVGADFDFDAIVTECASLDALRQRFGRLDRRGELQGEAQAAIVVGHRQIDEKHEDPIYGTAIASTWKWLEGHVENGTVDFSIEAQRKREPFPDGAIVPAKRAPELLPAYLDLWVQTSPKPAIEPDIPVFLHGAQKGAPQAQVLWRADISDQLLGLAIDSVDSKQAERVRGSLESLFEICPPCALEAVTLPLWAARDWLAQLSHEDSEATMESELAEISDIEGAQNPDAMGGKRTEFRKGTTKSDQVSPFVVFSSGSMSVSRDPGDIGPGSIVVLPSTRGGLSPRTRNWDPASKEPVRDLGDRAQLVQRGRAIVRWSALQTKQAQELEELVDVDELEIGGEATLREAFFDWAGARGSEREKHQTWLDVASDWISLSPKSRVLEIPRPEIGVDAAHIDDSDNIVASTQPWRVSVRYTKLPREMLRSAAGFGGSTESLPDGEDRSSFVNKKISLFEHLEGVQAYSEAFARQSSLSENLINDLELAGLLHDLGKSDPRFQRMLQGGDPVDAIFCDELLAKSDLAFFDLARRRRAKILAGYPNGARHEVMSLALVEGSSKYKSMARDWDLVLYLVSSHHGYCRPFAPVLYDEQPTMVEVSFQGEELSSSSNNGLDHLERGVPRRFWKMVRRYGWHGLAYLEAVLRLADHRRSEFEQQESANR